VSALGWFLAGMVTLSVISVTAMAIVDREFRNALGQVAAVAVVGPAALVMTLTKRGPRAARISPQALGRFWNREAADMHPTWLLSYAGRGVLFLRRRDSDSDRVSGLGRSRRVTPINVREAPDDRTE
jgi:hypothetical protein